MKWIMKLTLCLITLKIFRDEIYTWIFELTNGAKYIMEGNNLFIYQGMSEIGGLVRAKGR